MTINYGRNKLVIARHEAGHAVIARALNINIKYATLEDVNGYPQTVTESAAHQRPSDLDALEHDAIVALAGPLAQQRHRPLSQSEQDRAWEDGGDWYDDRLVVFSSLGRLLLRRSGEQVVEGQHVVLEGERAEQFLALFNCTRDKATALVDQHWPASCRVAKALMSDRVLSEAEIDALIEGNDLQRASLHQAEAGGWAASGLWFLDDVAERGGRADPSQGDAGHPNH